MISGNIVYTKARETGCLTRSCGPGGWLLPGLSDQRSRIMIRDCPHIRPVLTGSAIQDIVSWIASNGHPSAIAPGMALPPASLQSCPFDPWTVRLFGASKFAQAATTHQVSIVVHDFKLKSSIVRVRLNAHLAAEDRHPPGALFRTR
jgi:hypothetical protein